MTEFQERLLLQLVGPVFTAIVGTLFISLFVSRVTRQAQERRTDSQLLEQQRRSENQLRVQLVDQMTEAASRLYMASQHYWRKRYVEQVGQQELTRFRDDLDQAYRASSVTGEVIQRRLEVYFVTVDARDRWHATMDLLTVRYFTLIDLATDRLLGENAGMEHSGLTVQQLRDQKLVLNTYRERISSVVRLVTESQLRPLSG